MPVLFENQLSGVESLGVSGRGVTLDAPEPQDRPERLFCEPLILRLGLEAFEDLLDLFIANLSV